eukprot:COSAG05_NODE_11657_length_503_cov_0.891089_1_plen_28_part_10
MIIVSSTSSICRTVAGRYHLTEYSTLVC